MPNTNFDKPVPTNLTIKQNKTQIPVKRKAHTQKTQATKQSPALLFLCECEMGGREMAGVSHLAHGHTARRTNADLCDAAVMQ